MRTAVAIARDHERRSVASAGKNARLEEKIAKEQALAAVLAKQNRYDWRAVEKQFEEGADGSTSENRMPISKAETDAQVKAAMQKLLQSKRQENPYGLGATVVDLAETFGSRQRVDQV